MLKTICFIAIVLFVQLSFAETCPSVKDLKSNRLKGWTAVNLNSSKPLNEFELQQFEINVTRFALAAWSTEAPIGSSMCYYYGSSSDPCELNALLSKETGPPDITSPFWKKQDDIMRCIADVKHCRFL